MLEPDEEFTPARQRACARKWVAVNAVHTGPCPIRDPMASQPVAKPLKIHRRRNTHATQKCSEWQWSADAHMVSRELGP